MSFLKATAIRAVRTAAQTAIALIGTAQFISDIDWIGILSGTAVAALLSVLTSIVTGLPEVADGQAD